MDSSYKSEARHFQKKIRIAISQIFSQFSTSGPLTINYHLKHVVNRTFFILFSDCYFTYSALYFSQIRSLFTRHIADQSSTTALEYVYIHFKHDEAGCGHNVQAVDPIPQQNEQFRSLAAVAEEVRGPDTPSVSPPTTTIASRNLGSWVRSPCWMVARGRLLYLSHSSGFL